HRKSSLMKSINFTIQSSLSFWENKDGIPIGYFLFNFMKAFFYTFVSRIIVGKSNDQSIKRIVVHPFICKNNNFRMQHEYQNQIQMGLVIGNNHRRLGEIYFVFIYPSFSDGENHINHPFGETTDNKGKDALFSLLRQR